jgi:hypothetical protein
MKSANAVKTYRKSGEAEGRDLRCAIRVPRIYRSSIALTCRPDRSAVHHSDLCVDDPSSECFF